jgi:hypothetical protein
MNMRFALPVGVTLVFLALAFRVAHYRKRGAWFEWTFDYINPKNYDPAAQRWLPWFLLAAIAAVVAWFAALV